MKNTFEYYENLTTPLTLEELQEVTGGESFWFRFGEAAGWVAGKVANFTDAIAGYGGSTVGATGAAIR